MLDGQDRGQTREVFFRAWQAHRAGKPLESIEKIIVHVALRHPEYHALLDQPDAARDRDYSTEANSANPFMHLGMHIAIEEQLSIDQPRGIRACYREILRRLPNEHHAQHRMMDCLSEMLWQANRQSAAFDESIYLNCLYRIADNKL